MILCEKCDKKIGYMDGRQDMIWTDLSAGVCNACGRELCSGCGDWDELGNCPDCQPSEIQLRPISHFRGCNCPLCMGDLRP